MDGESGSAVAWTERGSTAISELGVPPRCGVGLRRVSLRSSRLQRDRCAALCPPHAGMYAKGNCTVESTRLTYDEHWTKLEK